MRSRGIELEAVANFDSGIDLIAAYTYLHTEIIESNDGNEGKEFPSAPEHQVSVFGEYTLRNGALAGIDFGAGVRFIGSIFGDNANTFDVPGYTLVDAVLDYEWPAFHFAVNADNLFDYDHVVTCFFESGCFYSAQRTVIGTLRYRW